MATAGRNSEADEIYEVRLTAALPLPPFAAGAVVTLVFLGAYQGLHTLFGSWPWVQDPETGLPIESNGRGAILVSMLLGYALAATRDMRGKGERAMGHLDGDRDSEAARVRRDPLRARLRVVGLATASAVFLIGLALVMLVPVDALAADAVWFLLVLPFFFATVARLVYLTARDSRGVAENLQLALEIDLLDLRPVFLIGRTYLRFALHWIVGISIAALFFLSRDLIAPLAPLMTVTLLVAGMSLFLPVRGIRAKLREAKAAELDRITAELRRAREAAFGGNGGAGRLGDLLSYRAYVSGLPDWPFDAATLTRFGLYLLIPLGSWFGGAFVERLVSALLD